MLAGGEAFEAGVEVGLGVARVEGLRGRVLAGFEAEQPPFECGEVGEVRVMPLRCTIEKKISTWLSHEASIGRCTSTEPSRVFCRPARGRARGQRS